MAMPRRSRLAAMLALTAVAGCQSFPTWDNPFKTAQLAVRLDEGSASAPITVERNQTLVVTLEANVTTGYRWETVAETKTSPIVVTLKRNGREQSVTLQPPGGG